MSRPFDEARYRGLLEGLEITELALSDVRKENDKLRIDSGYFAKPMLAADRQVRAYRGGCDELGSLFGRFAKGVFDINAESYTESGVPFLRILNLRSGIIDDANLALIPEWVHEAEKKTELLKGEIVLSKTAYPAASVVTLERCNTSQDTIATSLCEYGKSTYTPEAIVAYLNSSLGERLLWRQFQGNVQLHLSLDDGRKVPVPRLGRQIQEAITSAFDRAHVFRKQAISASEQAEQTLLRALGLENWQPPEPLTYTRLSRDAFAAGRLDAEYFYPAKQAALDKLAALPGRAVGEMFNSMREMWRPEDAPANQPIRNYNLTDALTPFLDTTAEPVYPAAIASNKKRIQKGDLVVSRLRSYLREIAVALDGSDVPMVASTEFIVLRPKVDAMRVEALLVYLRSTLPQLIFKWSQDGSNHPRFDEKELLNLRVPDIVLAEQDRLAEMLQSTIRNRRRAAELLAAAKRAVEIAIESGEASAIAFLDQSLEATPE